MTPRLTSYAAAAVLIGAAIVQAQEPTRSAAERAESKEQRAEELKMTVADGVYAEAQAVRGSASYDAACARCHRADLTGADGPELRGERFARNFADRDLKTLYTKIATTMPRGLAGSLGDDIYLDIVAHVLRENGFPAGDKELTADALDAIRVLPGRPKPPPPVGDFSYVEVVGCLAAGPNNTWLLTHAGEPVSVVLSGESAPQLPTDLETRDLGGNVFHLLDAIAYNPQSHAGRKMYVRGLLIRLPSERRLTISSFEPIASACAQ